MTHKSKFQKAFIYCRVSTDKQETERQMRDLREYCLRQGFEIVGEYEENISATKSKALREHLIERVVLSKANIFIAQDISRFSRNVKVGLELKDALHDKGICLMFANQGIRSLNEDGTQNESAQLVFVVLLGAWEMENATKRAMIKSGLMNAKARGKVLGRPVGFRTDLVSKYPKVVKYLNAGHSVREVAKLCDTHKSLVQRVKKCLNLP